MRILERDSGQIAGRLASRFRTPVRIVQGIGVTRRQEARKEETPVLFHIRLAQMSDMSAIIGLIDKAAEWLGAEKGTDQWQKPWPNLAARDRRIRRGIKAGRTWIVEDWTEPVGGPRRLVATVSCGRGGNKKLWTLRERNEPAVYISRLIISRQHAGRGIGAALINWVGLRGLRNWDAQWIRLDVWTTNAELQTYYKGQEFNHLKTWTFDDPWEYPSAAVFQKPTTEIDLAAAKIFQEVS